MLSPPPSRCIASNRLHRLDSATTAYERQTEVTRSGRRFYRIWIQCVFRARALLFPCGVRLFLVPTSTRCTLSPMRFYAHEASVTNVPREMDFYLRSTPTVWNSFCSNGTAIRTTNPSHGGGTAGGGTRGTFRDGRSLETPEFRPVIIRLSRFEVSMNEIIGHCTWRS